MNLIYTGYTFRTVDNYRPLLDELAVRGHNISSMIFPHQSTAMNLQLGDFPYRCLANRPFLNPQGFPAEELQEIVRSSISEFSADVILLDDIMNYPSNMIYPIVKQFRPDIPVIGFQHGFFQFWDIYRRRFACDCMLVYGNRDRREFSPPLSERVVAFGLPKLSRLQNVNTSDNGTVLFVGQDFPRPDVVFTALREFAESSGMHIDIRLHPEHNTYRAENEDWMTVLEPDDDIIPYVASCHAVITTGSTAGIEALCLDKPVVSLPSHTSVIFRDSPCIAYDYTGAEIARVINQYGLRKDELKRYLNDVVSQVSFNMGIAADLFERIAGSAMVSRPV